MFSTIGNYSDNHYRLTYKMRIQNLRLNYFAVSEKVMNNFNLHI